MELREKGKVMPSPKVHFPSWPFAIWYATDPVVFLNNTGGSTAMSGGILRPSLSLPLPGRFRADHPCSNVR